MLSPTPLPMAVVLDVCLTSHLGAPMGEENILLEAHGHLEHYTPALGLPGEAVGPSSEAMA